MNIWVKVVRENGNTYRVGDIAGVYELADGESPPDLSGLTVTDGRVPFASLGITNLPPRLTDLRQAERMLHKPFAETVADPGDPEGPDVPEDNPLRLRRSVHLRKGMLTPPQRRALFDTPPYTLTLTWAQFRAFLYDQKKGRPVVDDDIPDKPVDVNLGGGLR